LNRKFHKILAVIPCYNEAGAIGNLLEEFSALDFRIDTLVIDDGSQDDTYSIANRFSKVIRLEKNQGVVAGIALGIRYALENSYDYSIQIDGDGQHIPTKIASFLHVLETDSPNILTGSRYYGQRLPRRCEARRIAGWIYSCQLRLLFGKWLSDPLSGMRMMDKAAMEYYIHHMNEFSLDAEIVPRALRAGLSIWEVPVDMRPRENGDSYVSGLKGLKFFIRLSRITLAIRFS